MRIGTSADVYDAWVAQLRLTGGITEQDELHDILTQARLCCERLHPPGDDPIATLTHLVGARILAAYMVVLVTRPSGSVRDLAGADDARLKHLRDAAGAMPGTPVEADLRTSLDMTETLRTMALRAVGL
ncbi:MAG: hypothetical protein AAF714_01690 [Pseudomonadota bacterium]